MLSQALDQARLDLSDPLARNAELRGEFLQRLGGLGEQAFVENLEVAIFQSLLEGADGFAK